MIAVDIGEFGKFEIENRLIFFREKQFKRKVDEWGFTKNITSREMVKMVRKRKRRENEQGKATVFKRSRNGVDFEVVAPVKLDRFQKRNRLEELESGSESSGLSSSLQTAVMTDILTRHAVQHSVRYTVKQSYGSFDMARRRHCFI